MTDKRSFYCCLKLGKSFIMWKKFQSIFYKISVSGYFQLFIAFCIILNTIFMALQYPNQSDEITNLIITSNDVTKERKIYIFMNI